MTLHYFKETEIFEVVQCHSYVTAFYKLNLQILYYFIPYRSIYVTHASRALLSQDLSEEGINFESHTYFLTTQGHGRYPRMTDQLNAGATSETTRT